jgi:putative cell wall-binding protein
MIASVLALVSAPASAAQAVTITTRSTLQGTDRYATSVAVHNVAQTANAGADFTDLVLASGDNYPDALSGIALAASQDAGLILLPADGTMSAKAITACTGATQIYIVGGTAALSSAVETKLKTTTAGGGCGKGSANITRIAGSDRYATAGMVANVITTTNTALYNTKKTAIVVSGQNWPDAVSASMLVAGSSGTAATSVHPVLLVNDTVPVATEIALVNLGVKQVVIIGGTAAVSSAVEAELAAKYSVTRVAGANRYDTAGKVADLAIKSITAAGFGRSKAKIVVAEMGGSSAADALAAGGLVNERAGVLLGTSGGALAAESEAWMKANPNGATVTPVVDIVGGSTTIPTATEAVIKVAAGGATSTVTVTITGRASQTTFSAVFSEAVTKTSAASAFAMINVDDATDGTTPVCTMLDTPSTLTSGKSYSCTTDALAKGDTIRHIANKAQTADGRKVAQTDYTVLGDTTKPVATINATTPSTGNPLTITFSETVKGGGGADMADGDIKIGGVVNTEDIKCLAYLGATAVTGFTTGENAGVGGELTALGAGETFTSIKCTKATAWTLGSNVQLIASAVQDLQGNTNAAASATIARDATAPTLSGSHIVSRAAGAQASYTIDGKVLVTMKATSTTTALAGENGWTISWTAAAHAASGAGTNTSTTCVLTTKDFEMDYISAGNATTVTSTAAQIAAAINTSATCSPYLTATVLSGATTITATLASAGDVTASFDGASESITVTSTFSEAMGTVLLGGHSYDPHGDGNPLYTATQANTTKVGATVTSVMTVGVYADRFIVNTSKVGIVDNKFYDVAGNDTGTIANALAIAG